MASGLRSPGTGDRPVASSAGLLAFLDPLLGGAALVGEANDRSAGKRQVRHHEPDAREQLASMVLDFRHDPARRGPAVRLILKTLVPDDRLVTGASW